MVHVISSPNGQAKAVRGAGCPTHRHFANDAHGLVLCLNAATRRIHLRSGRYAHDFGASR